MNIYFAPMEGLTDSVYRRVHRECFSGVDKYFIPFVIPTQHLSFTSREQRELSPEENAGIHAVPQILTKSAEQFLWMARSLRDAGYHEINLNMGCPSGTVTAKGKGSGMLRDLAALEPFLDEIFAGSPIPVSIKTRIGFESVEEWPALFDLLARYPIHELIVHPRTRREFYSGKPHAEVCGDALARDRFPIVYNGDLFSIEDCQRLMARYPGVKALMLGRGLIANPALAQALQGGEALTLPALRRFHDRLYAEYSARWPKNALIGHMHEIMGYTLSCFEDVRKPRKALRKATTQAAYLDAVNMLFDNHPLRENPYFHAEED